MRRKLKLLLGSVLVIAYAVYLYRSEGGYQTVNSQDGAVRLGSVQMNAWYTEVLEIGLFIAALYILAQFIDLVVNQQNWMLETPGSYYLDIYLIAFFVPFALILSYQLIHMGLGLGLTGVLVFGGAYAIAGLFAKWYRRRYIKFHR